MECLLGEIIPISTYKLNSDVHSEYMLETWSRWGGLTACLQGEILQPTKAVYTVGINTVKYY